MNPRGKWWSIEADVFCDQSFIVVRRLLFHDHRMNKRMMNYEKKIEKPFEQEIYECYDCAKGQRKRRDEMKYLRSSVINTRIEQKKIKWSISWKLEALWWMRYGSRNRHRSTIEGKKFTSVITSLNPWFTDCTWLIIIIFSLSNVLKRRHKNIDFSIFIVVSSTNIEPNCQLKKSLRRYTKKKKKKSITQKQNG